MRPNSGRHLVFVDEQSAPPQAFGCTIELPEELRPKKVQARKSANQEPEPLMNRGNRNPSGTRKRLEPGTQQFCQTGTGVFRRRTAGFESLGLRRGAFVVDTPFLLRFGLATSAGVASSPAASSAVSASISSTDSRCVISARTASRPVSPAPQVRVRSLVSAAGALNQETRESDRAGLALNETALRAARHAGTP